MRKLPVVAAFLAFVAAASAQSFNIEFGNPETAPSSSYAAAGRAGVWNVFGVMPTSQRFPMVDILGNARAARVYNIGASDLLIGDDPATVGDDAALMDDMLLSYNNPVDACIFMENLLNGTYEVLLYAMTPSNPSLLHRVRVDNAVQGPVMIGGAWPGQHVEGVTYERFTVSVTSGTLGMHSGLFGGNITSGLNGIQIRRIVNCAGDVNDDDRCDLTDLSTLLTSFGETSGQTLADGDLDGDADVDLADLAIVLANFGRVCQ